ncbi:probable WRKY transcription factor 10 isoform X2 [Cryptomeria japonica]|uniref:probable WRKY transcription factor 10 isoform X2 n=1 Tax=Cryptomeria japonica TaxID=3369 RepID=UPI0025AD8323|nr:probable WRKY transcription factor 10 isoform X2 [Cryptomeria japonica]
MQRKERYFVMAPTVKQQTYLEVAKAQTLDLESESFQTNDFLSFSENESDEMEQKFVKPHLHITPPPPVTLPLHSGKSAVATTGLSEGTSKGKDSKRKFERGERYTFKTRSESDTLEDGYKWRKYGRKKVKNSPNPRNYYKCADSQCCVKKRVERDANDKGIVITTYEGKHNHQSPSIVYYIRKPFVVVPRHASFDQSPPLFYTSTYQPEFMFMNTT